MTTVHKYNETVYQCELLFEEAVCLQKPHVKVSCVIYVEVDGNK